MDKLAIQQLIVEDKLNEALQAIENLEACENLSCEDQLTCQLFKSQALSKSGDVWKGLELASELLAMLQERPPADQLLLADAIITEVEATRLNRTFEYASPAKLSDQLQLLERAERILGSIPDLETRAFKMRLASLQRNKGLIYRFLKELDLAEECLQKSVALHGETGNRREMIGTMIDRVLVRGDKKDFDSHLETYDECLELSREIGDKESEARVHYYIARFHNYMGEPERARAHLQISQELLDELPETLRVAGLLRRIGSFYYEAMADGDTAIALMEEVLATGEKLGSKPLIRACLNNLGTVYHYSKGQFDRALDYFEKSKVLAEEAGKTSSKHSLAFSLKSIGEIHHLRGDLDLALINFQKSSTLFEEIGDDIFFQHTLLELGRVYRSKGDDTAALEHFERSLEIDERMAKPGVFATYLTFHGLILLSLDNKDRNKAVNYFERLKQRHEHWNLHVNPYLDHWYRLSEAVILKTSARISDKARAQQILQEIIAEKKGFSEWKNHARLYLCDLLLYELKAASDEIVEEKDIIQEIKQLLDVVTSSSQEYQASILLVNTLILRGKLSLIEGEFGMAMQFLDQAKSVAEEKQLEYLSKKVTDEEILFETQLDTWKNIIQSNATLQERLARARVEEYISKALKVINTR